MARRGAEHLGLVVAKAARIDGALQQKFRRLLERVDRLKQQLRAWGDERPNIERELAQSRAAHEQQRARARELVLLLDRAHGQLGRAERTQLAAILTDMSGELLDAGDDAELKAIYNRHGRGDFDAEVAESDTERAAQLKVLLEELGVDFGDADVGSIDKLQAFAEAHTAEAERVEAAATERRANRKKSAKQLAREARRADEERGAHKAVQEVYRALALVLHPDREQDPVERGRKAELMREVNAAYEAKDLLRLLELQLQIEHIDAAQGEGLAEDRVRHYVRVLDEQAKQLAAELHEIEFPFRIDLDLPPRAKLVPASLPVLIRISFDDVSAYTAAIERDLARFADAREVKAWLKEQRRRDRYDAFAP